jgi:hypothetical protein
MEERLPPVRIMLWSLPRSVSTAFEHSVRSLEGIKAFHEPFSAAYYLGEERRSPRYAGLDAVHGNRFRDVLDKLEASYSHCSALFAKDMAYAIDGDYSLLPKDYRHSFLIRDPRRSIPSLYRIMEGGKAPQWREFLANEVDYGVVADLYDHLRSKGQACPIVDAGDLLADPAGTMRAYCDAVGLSFSNDMLEWDASDASEQWAMWGVEWYETLTDSNGFIVKHGGGNVDLSGVPQPVRSAIDAAMPIYEKLRAARLRP